MNLIPASVPTMGRTLDTATDGSQADWKNGAGWAWQQRNPKSVEELDWGYEARYGFTRTSKAKEILDLVPRYGKVLEVGCSGGLQLSLLQRLGFSHLEGCDVCEKAMIGNPFPTKVTDGITLPYESKSFDMVFTSGTLMHVPPPRDAFCEELKRVSKKWIYGFELWDAEPREWSFGALLPNAWALPEPRSFSGVKVRRYEVHESERSAMKYVSYLLEIAA